MGVVTRLLGALLLAAGEATAAPPLPALPVADHLVLPAGSAELSGLAWRAEDRSLMAVSDRGHWRRWRLSLAPGRIAGLEAMASGRIGPGRVNAEAVVAAPGGGWLVADEAAHRVRRLDAQDRPAGERPLPPGLAGQAPGRHGVEALAWHGRHGLVAALQRPVAGHHVLHADDGWSCRVPVAAGGRSTLKDMLALDDRDLLLLEKQDLASGHRTLLRRVDLDRCGAPPATWVLATEGLPAGLNFEGLACVDTRRCLLVSDDGAGAGPTVLVLVEWP